MKDVGTYSNPVQRDVLHGGLEEFDKCTREGLVPTYDRNLFDWERSPANVIDCKFSSAATLRSTLQAAGYAEAEIHFSNSSTLQINIEGLETACVKDTRQISKLVKGHLWKPILEDVKMDNQTCTQALLGRTQKLWVVHQLLFASDLTATSTASASVGAKLVCDVVPGTAGVDLNIHNSLDKSNIKKFSNPRIGVKYPGKIPFAFRALCFRFNAAGECVGMEGDAGAVRPKVRGEDNLSHEQERAQISDLFVGSAPSDVDSDDDEPLDLDLHALPIIEPPFEA
jgi:hypothetical protein